jgi:outer membrane receptor for ferrienterochelin and colicin
MKSAATSFVAAGLLTVGDCAVYVIGSEDIRRSGATSLAEALRLAPNLDVARVDANQYAISARGFNNVLANRIELERAAFIKLKITGL